jgi:hypothetical protein
MFPAHTIKAGCVRMTTADVGGELAVLDHDFAQRPRFGHRQNWGIIPWLHPCTSVNFPRYCPLTLLLG